MNKTEEYILIGVAVLFLLKMMNGNTSATQLAAIQANTNIGYANAASSAIGSIFGGDDDD